MFLAATMSVNRPVAIGTTGSILAFILAFCGDPLLLFGTKTVAGVLWYFALALAAISALVLLHSFLKSVWRTATQQTSPVSIALPLGILVAVLAGWWRFFAFLAAMP